MRLSELLGLSVIDSDGRGLGQVRDVRLVQDGPFIEGFGHALRVEGLLVGGGALGVRLGIARAGVRGPWPLTTWFRWRERRARYIDWSDVAGHDERELHLRPGAHLAGVADLEQA